MMGGMDFMDDMNTEKTHLWAYVHSVHSVHYLDKSNQLKLPSPGSHPTLRLWLCRVSASG